MDHYLSGEGVGWRWPAGSAMKRLWRRHGDRVLGFAAERSHYLSSSRPSNQERADWTGLYHGVGRGRPKFR
jgi:hypothetical protein